MTTLAYSHTLVAGTPENINDVQDMFGDIRTVVNGNLDATNLAASAKPATQLGVYKAVGEARFFITSAMAAGLWYASDAGTKLNGLQTNSSMLVIPITLADFSPAGLGLTTQFRVKGALITNATAPAVNFTYGLHSIASAAGGASVIIPTLNAATAGSTVTRAAPASGTSFIDASSDFTISLDVVYLLGVTLSGAPAANSGTSITLQLQVHHV